MYTISGETSKPVEKCMATVVTGIFAVAILRGGAWAMLRFIVALIKKTTGRLDFCDRREIERFARERRLIKQNFILGYTVLERI